MSAMVERIARLISEEDRREADEAPDFVEWHWEERADLARAIIAAMREPTEAMIAGAAEDENGCVVVWHSMVDAALKE